MKWESCVNHLKSELPSQQFNTWIRPLQAESNSDILTLFAPNRFVLDWVKDKFLSRIHELLRDGHDGPVNVVLEIGAREATPLAMPERVQTPEPTRRVVLDVPQTAPQAAPVLSRSPELQLPGNESPYPPAAPASASPTASSPGWAPPTTWCGASPPSWWR